jgi:hypothetical protein
MNNIKIAFDKEIHLYKGQLSSFQELLNFVKGSFKKLP